MANIPPNLYNQLRRTLLNCGPFTNNAELKAIFVDTRISCWRDNLPDAINAINRVNATIDFLSGQSNVSGENALVLLLHVLSDQKSPDDVCHQQLAALTNQLQQQIKVSDTITDHVESVSEVTYDKSQGKKKEARRMTKAWKSKLDKTQIIVAVVAAMAAILAAYWQFVWKPSRSSPSIPNLQMIEYVGRVLDINTNEPIHNAKITLDFQGVPPIVYTDSEGIYRFTLSVGNNKIVGRIRVDADTYDKYDRNITLLADNSSIEDIRLAPR